MKQLLFLLLFPCFAMAQYQENGNQKITLGEQTTADGLVYRGRLADTANLLTNKLDTSVYIVLDTGTRAMWYYRASTTPKWTRLVDSLNNLQGTLSVANGGTGSATQNFVDLTTTQNIDGAKTFTSDIIGARFRPSATTASSTGIFAPTSTSLGFSTNGSERMRLTNSSLSLFNNTPLGYPLEVYGTDANTRLVIRGTTNPLVTQYVGSGGTWYMGMDDSAGLNYTGIAYARFIYSSLDIPFIFYTNAVERLKIHGSGGLKFKPQSAPTAEEGTVYYDSTAKKLKVYNGTSWIDLH